MESHWRCCVPLACRWRSVGRRRIRGKRHGGYRADEQAGAAVCGLLGITADGWGSAGMVVRGDLAADRASLSLASDFLVQWEDGRLELHDTKGWVRDDALVKAKAVA